MPSLLRLSAWVIASSYSSLRIDDIIIEEELVLYRYMYACMYVCMYATPDPASSSRLDVSWTVRGYAAWQPF